MYYAWVSQLTKTGYQYFGIMNSLLIINYTYKQPTHDYTLFGGDTRDKKELKINENKIK